MSPPAPARRPSCSVASPVCSPGRSPWPWANVGHHRQRADRLRGPRRAPLLPEAPAGRKAELVAMLEEMGMTTDTATRATEEIHRDESRALNFHLVQELGVDPREKPSAWVAAGSSFVLFAIGAIIPLIPYLLDSNPVGGPDLRGSGSARRRRGRRPVHQQAAVVGGVAAAGIWRDRDRGDVCRRHPRRHGDNLSYMLRRLLLACCLDADRMRHRRHRDHRFGAAVPGSDAGVARRDAGRHGHRRPVGHQLRPVQSALLHHQRRPVREESGTLLHGTDIGVGQRH